MPDGRVEFEITADGKKAYASIDQITEELKKAGIKWEKDAKTSTDQINGSFEGMVKKITSVIAAAGIGKMFLNIGKDAIQAASDLEEVQNVVDVTFGNEGAKKIEAWAEKAGSQFGLTETQAKRFTSTLGAMMKSSGMAGDEIVEMSTDLAGLAADMASFYNLDFDTAFQKIRSGISGETEPLKQLGINMSVANLNAFALQKGLEKTFDQMDQGEQTMLRYQYLMEATADAQGDFSRTLDGFANSKRLFETNLETLKTNIGSLLIGPVNDAIGWINNLFGALTQEPERTIIDDVNAIDVDTAEQMEKLTETYNKASDVIKLINEIEQKTVTKNNGETVTLAELFGEMSQIEKSGGDINAYLQSLGVNTEYVAREYQVWQKSMDELERLVPGLTGDIRDQTGAIDGTSEALQENLDAWKANEEKKIRWAAYYAKERALEERKGELSIYQFDAGAAKQQAKRLRDNLEKTYGAVFGENGELLTDEVFGDFNYGQWLNDAEEYRVALEKQNKLEEQLAENEEAIAEVEQQLKDGKAALIEELGEEEKATENLSEANAELAEKAKQAYETAMAEVEAYRETIKEATKQAVDSVIKGFERIEKAENMFQIQTQKLADEEADVLSKYSDVFSKWGGSDSGSLKNMADNWDNLSDKEKEAYNAMIKVKNEQAELNREMDKYKPTGMKAALDSQLEFIQEYQKNLETVRNTGVISEKLLAELSDGSEESARYLYEMANAARSGDTKSLEELNKSWLAVQEGKEGFVDALTEQKLAADEKYDAMIQKAQEAAKEAGESVQTMAEGIKANVPAVASAVDAVLAELNRLTGWGINVDFGFGSFGISVGNFLNGEHETGLNFVPFDGYLAKLHEGEGILTAEENRIWQQFKNGQQGVDYDTLGGLMRENVKAGGNVYLDGRVVGSVVSDIQGKSFRQLQRSGWQG